MNRLPKARINEIVVQEVEDEILIYDLKTDKIYSLNETTSFVWKNCDGKQSVEEIIWKLNRQFQTKVDEDFIYLALENLQKENLLETEVELLKMPRRELIKKIGLSSMIALPLITSFFAPTAANAQSVGSGGCVVNAQGCNSSTIQDLFVFSFMGSPTPFCQFNDPNCQTICDGSINQCCSCMTVLLPDTINAAFVCRCV